MLRNQNCNVLGIRLAAVMGLCMLVFGNVTDAQTGGSKESETSVLFTGGHETDPRDHGRPVALVAAGLGVTDDKLNEVSNYYCYPPDPGAGYSSPPQVSIPELPAAKAKCAKASTICDA